MIATEYRKAYKAYCEKEAKAWLEIANNLCDGSKENLERYAYAMKKYRDFKYDAERSPKNQV